MNVNFPMNSGTHSEIQAAPTLEVSGFVSDLGPGFIIGNRRPIIEKMYPGWSKPVVSGQRL